MPYVITYSLFPPDKGEEAAKLYLSDIKEERSKTRELAKEVVPNAIKATKDGIDAISIYDVKVGKLEEFLNFQQNTMVKYHQIEGYRYSIEVRFNVGEALAMIGMKMPE